MLGNESRVTVVAPCVQLKLDTFGIEMARAEAHAISKTKKIAHTVFIFLSLPFGFFHRRKLPRRYGLCYFLMLFNPLPIK
jgi:hypothetical protein